MRRVSAIVLASLALACGSAAPPVSSARIEAPVMEPAPPPFAGHGPVVLRSVAPSPALTTAQPPLYAELAADGSVTGTRCGATRFTDQGELEREGTVIASVVPDGDAFFVEDAQGRAIGWRIEGSALIAAGGARFPIAAGTISPADAELPAITVDPATTSDTLALALFATLLVCDDVGP